MRKIYLFLLTLLCAVGASAQITELSGLSNDKCYTIKAQGRGYLYYDSENPTKMASSSKTTVTNETPDGSDVNNQIAILRTANTPTNQYYLYSVSARKFLSYSGSGVAVSLTETPFAWELTKVTSSSVNYFTIKIPGTEKTHLNVTNSANGADNGCRVAKADHDAGNRMVIKEASSFSSSSADAIIAVYEMQHVVTFNHTQWENYWTLTEAYPQEFTTLDEIKGFVANTRIGKHDVLVDYKGTYPMTVTFAYTGGGDKLAIMGADLIDGNGDVVAKDYHYGYAGSPSSKNVYTLNGMVAGTYLLRFYVSHGTYSPTNPNDRHNLSGYSGTATIKIAEAATQEQMNGYFSQIKGGASVKYNACNGGTNNGKLGYYSTTTVNALNDAITTAAEVSGDATLTDITPLTDGITGLRMLYPTPGKFYRFKSKQDNKYIQASSNGSKFAMAELTDKTWDHASVFYLTPENKFLNFKSGTYLKDTHTQGNVGEEGNVISILTSEGGNLGYFTLKSNYSGSQYLENDGSNLNRNSGYTSGGSCDWTVEEVGWLPVPMNAAAGYATLYSPVQLALSYDRVKAYAVSEVTSTSVKLQSLENIPANVGVILKLNSALERGCVFLQVTGGDATASSELSGTLASEKITGDAYVLSKVVDNIGLYKAQKNQDSSTKWINNGFKAYLSADLVTGGGSGTGEARFLTFDFDDNAETGISAVEIEEAAPANAAIYDLSGRRVQSAKSGLYIINGKKVIK